MRRRRVTGRFYIFLMIVALIAFLIARPFIFSGPKESVIMMANSAYTQKLDCIIIRDEAVTYLLDSLAVVHVGKVDDLRDPVPTKGPHDVEARASRLPGDEVHEAAGEKDAVGLR